MVKREQIDYDLAVESIGKFPWVLMYQFSEIKLCSGSQITENDWMEATEVRAFDDSEEIHFLVDERIALRINDNDLGDKVDYIDREYELSNLYKKATNKEKFTVRQYLEVDEDGQKYICTTRLLDIQ